MPSRLPLAATHTVAPARGHPNLGPTQRLFSMVGGLALILNGLRRPNAAGVAQIALGAGVTWRGYTGVCQLTHAFDHTAYEHFMEHSLDWRSSKAVTRSVTIRHPRKAVFRFFLQPQKLGSLIPWVEDVEALDEHGSRWTAHASLPTPLSWTMKQNVIAPDQAIQWDTAYQGPWKHRIEATFTDAPQGRGTEVKVVLACEPYPGSAAYALASAIARFSDRALFDLLRQVKQQLETGEVATNHRRTAEVVDFVPPPQSHPGTSPGAFDSAMRGEE